MSGNERRGAERLLDLAVYAPLGFALEFKKMYPDFAARGRRQIMFTKTLGKAAVTRGGVELRKRLHSDEDASAEVPQPDSAAPEPSPPVADGSPQEPSVPTVPDTSPADLAIADYDSLSAQHVVRRLAGLTPADLESVRAYEELNRGRRTILSRIAQLQA
jgi:hypothetical protein